MKKKKERSDIRSRRWLKHARRLLKEVGSYRDEYRGMSDEQLQSMTEAFRARIRKGEKMDAILPEAFAAVREASRRTTGMFPYDVQVLVAIALHEGKIAELKTGEGKTLISSMPAYLHALTGKGVHVVTVNDYLAQRDSDNIGRIFRFMGMTVGTVISTTPPHRRKSEYDADITYVTNSELGFDYLRDNMARRQSDTVQRGLEYAIIDEIDSVLIDEARTPLIISGEGDDVSQIYTMCDRVAKSMKKGEESAEFNRIEAMMGSERTETGDFIIHEKEKNITITAAGVKAIEKAFSIEKYADPRYTELQHVMDQALKANYIMKKDKDYIVRDGKVLIIDSFTGRIMDGRQYSDGLHQAIEAKEGVSIQSETQTIASTTYQSFFNKYATVSGMTGTAYTERKEFMSTYGLQVVVIPTRKPVIRNDREDVLYLTKKGKMKGILNEVRRAHAKGQPVLIGTASVRASERVSAMLDREGIHHEMLNAKQDKAEADIIAEAGKHGAITVATNIAGRGTDIILDDEARKAGGLMVIGTERHESVRIDNQLRGRSGRQGDPGETVFYLSAEDDIMRLYSGDRIRKTLEKGGYQEDEPIESRILRKAMKKAQQKVEDNNFAARKDVLEYDRVNDRQRELIYAERRRLLAGDDVSGQMRYCLHMTAGIMTGGAMKGGRKKWNYAVLIQEYEYFTGRASLDISEIKGKSPKKVRRIIEKHLKEDFLDGSPEDGDSARSAERGAILTAIDTAWMEQLRALEFLKQDIFYLGYAQKDAKTEYALEAFRLYGMMKSSVYTLATYMYFQQRKAEQEMEIEIPEPEERTQRKSKMKIRKRRDGSVRKNG